MSTDAHRATYLEARAGVSEDSAQHAFVDSAHIDSGVLEHDVRDLEHAQRQRQALVALHGLEQSGQQCGACNLEVLRLDVSDRRG